MLKSISINKDLLTRLLIGCDVSQPEVRFENFKLTWILTLDFLSNPGHWLRIHHDNVIKWKHFPRYWPWWIPRTKASDALVFSLIYAWINGWVNNREAGNLRRHRAHYDVIVMMRQCNTSLGIAILSKSKSNPGITQSILLDCKSILVHVVAWCRQATSHYLCRYLLRSMLPCGITRPQQATGLDA